MLSRFIEMTKIHLLLLGCIAAALPGVAAPARGQKKPPPKESESRSELTPVKRTAPAALLVLARDTRIWPS